MAGMLPGVESARRRRVWGSSSGWWSESLIPPSSSSSNSSRRSSSFCLYTTNHNSLHTSSNSKSHLLQQRSSILYNDDEKLEGIAKQAKERLDERLGALYRKSQPKSNRRIADVLDQAETTRPAAAASGGLRKSVSKRMTNWSKLSKWKSSEQDECAVCLEQFRDTSSQNLAHLPCAHRFHSACLVPWLQNNAHCPCCRTPL